MPKGTIKNQMATPVLPGIANAYSGGLEVYDPENDSNLRVGDMLRYISLIPVNENDKVYFKHMILARKDLAVVKRVL